MSARIRTRLTRRRARPLSADARWAAYLAGVEPALAATPRVHRFAQPPVIGAPESAGVPVAVWIEPGSPEALARTVGALAQGTVAPVELLEGELAPALAVTRAERVLLLSAGDAPAPLALARLGQAAALAPDAAVITCDEDLVDLGGRRSSPRFRPGPSPDRWLACDDSGSLLLVDPGRAAAVILALAQAPGTPGWRHELALRLAGAGGEAHAHVPMLLLHRAEDRLGAAHGATAGVTAVLSEREPHARVETGSGGPGIRRIRRAVAGEPSVEVIVCLRDRPELLRRCADTLLARTAWANLRLALVDNGSVQSQTAQELARLAGDRRVRILRDPSAFNFAALNNLAARSSEADVLVFLNNDTEIEQAGWLEALLEEALRPEVGAVAPMLVFADGSVQHAGAALGLHGYAGHPFAGLAPDAPTPFGRADGGARNWLAVTAACLAVERGKFAAVGGFDESFVVAGNDVDLCLRLTAAGQRSLCLPQAVVIHAESRSRGSYVDPGDFVTSERSYGEFRTVGDPFYNPNLTLDTTDCSVRLPSP